MNHAIILDELRADSRMIAESGIRSETENHLRLLPGVVRLIATEGNAIVEQAVHILDLMNWSVQDHPIRVMGSGGINVWKDRPEGRSIYDNYVCIYEYPSGVRLTYTHLFIDPRGFTGIQEKGWGSEWAIALPSATKYRLHEERGKAPESVSLLPEGAERANSTQAAVDGFFEMVRGKAPHINTPIYGKWATLMAIMGRKAIDERRVVAWSEVDLG
jgi:predicted dehydrogenase